MYFSLISPLCSIVRYEIHLLESNIYGVNASVGQASRHFTQEPHKSSVNSWSYSKSISNNISPRKNQDPISLLIKLLTFVKCYLTKTHEFSIPIICIGNIYLGGTGKTPLSIEIFSILKNLKNKPVFIRKKYSAYQDEVNLQKEIGPIYQNKKRVEAIREAIKNKADVAILDDGFQDFSVKKNLSIICFNEKQWIGNGLTIPSGPLRESLSSLKRANLVIINGNKNNVIESKILKKNKTIKIFYSKYDPLNIDVLKNKNVIAFAGIGNPENFFNLLKNNNINVIDKTQKNNSILVTTEKDYFRINKKYKENINFLKVMLKIKQQDQFIEEIKKFIWKL